MEYPATYIYRLYKSRSDVVKMYVTNVQLKFSRPFSPFRVQQKQ